MHTTFKTSKLPPIDRIVCISIKNKKASEIHHGVQSRKVEELFN